MKHNATVNNVKPIAPQMSQGVRLSLLAASLCLIPVPVLADKGGDGENRPFCSKTAKAVFKACGFEIKDDYWIAVGQCINESDEEDRQECFQEAREELAEGKRTCKAQRQARRTLCDAVGEGRYDPDFDEEDFVDPLQIGQSVAPNPYFPLVPGTQWVYEGGDETITVTVTDKTKLIDDVTCVVVNDRVEEDGALIEDTDDWYAQDLAGNVWYCGEIALNYETFEGDSPDDPEVVDIDGSWKADRDGAKPGILISATPQVGDIYQQEVALGEAEDVAEVIDVAGNESVAAGFACQHDCVVTKDYTPIEPGAIEHKHFLPGVGMILEADMEGNRVELVEFTAP